MNRKTWCVAVLLLVATLVWGQNCRVTLAWDESPSPSVAGYRVYFGPASRTYTNTVDVGHTTNVTVSVPAGAVSYYAATAYDTSGLESDFSAEISYQPAAGQRLATLAGKSYTTNAPGVRVIENQLWTTNAPGVRALTNRNW